MSRRTDTEYVSHLDALDAFQLIKGVYAWSLVIAHVFDLPDPQIETIGSVMARYSDLNTNYWIALLAAYAFSSTLCLRWKNNAWQLGISFVSLFIWVFGGVFALQLRTSAVTGLFQLALGVISIFAMYYRGRTRAGG